MGRISLVIGDIDEDYLEGLMGFLMENYYQKFQVNFFTAQTSLTKYLTESNKKVDILLLAPEMYSISLPIDTMPTKILLTSGKVNLDGKVKHAVNKYQNADRLVNSIINIYAEEDGNEGFSPTGRRKTRIIAVYSPVGGVGKTSVALNCSAYSVQKGSSVFYLNLENINSSTCLFRSSSEQNLSNIFYYLKEKNKSLSLKLEGVRCVDEETGVYYFAPPDSIMEIEALNPPEIQELIRVLKNTGLYDVIYIDMSSNFDKRNVAILEAVDEIFFIGEQEEGSNCRVKACMKELDILFQRNQIPIREKITPITNKNQRNDYLKAKEVTICGKVAKVRLPFVQRETDDLFITDSEYCHEIHRLVSQ